MNVFRTSRATFAAIRSRQARELYGRRSEDGSFRGTAREAWVFALPEPGADWGESLTAESSATNFVVSERFRDSA